MPRLVAVLLLLVVAPARATDFVVPDDLPTVQAGLDAAMPGDTVSVRDTPGPLVREDRLPAQRRALCAYDASASPQPLLRAVVPPGGRWTTAGDGFRYRDPTASAAGIRTMKLVPGAEGSARVIVRGKGDALPLPAFPLTPPVAVQLRTDAGECWGATYSAPSRNDGGGFTGRSD